MNKRNILLSFLVILVAISMFAGFASGEGVASLSISSCPSVLSLDSSADVYAHLFNSNETTLIDEPIVWRVVSGESVTIVSDSAYGSHIIIVPVSSGVSVISAASVNYPDIYQMAKITVSEAETSDPVVMMDTEPVMRASSVQASGDPIPTSISFSSYSGLSWIGSDTLGTTLGCSPSISVSVYDQYGNSLSSEDVDWHADNESVLALNPSTWNLRNAELTLNDVGTAVITATSKSNASLSREITVVVAEPVITSLSFRSFRYFTWFNWKYLGIC